MRLLIAEDEVDLREVLVEYLKSAGYEVEAVTNGREALEQSREKAFDGMVMDIMMPEMSGLDALEQMRKEHNMTPILLLTAMSEVDDRIKGLDAGADDYLTKPFSLGELLARVRSMTRRKSEYTQRILSYGGLSLDIEEGVCSSTNSIQLAVKESRMLEFFLRNPEKKIKEEHLIEQIWKEEDADLETLDLYINILNRKLESIGAACRIKKIEKNYRLQEVLI